MDAAQRGQKAGSVPPFPLPDVRFAPGLRAAAFPRSERSALPCDRPRRFASTQAAISDGAEHKRSFYKQAHKRPNRLCCLCLLSISPNLQREGPAAQPRNPSAQKAVKSDSLDNKHRNAVPNVKILLKTHSKQSKKASKSNPLDDERRNVLPDDRSSFRMAQQTIRHLPAESEPVRQDETQKSRKPLIEQPFGFLRPTEKCVVVRNASFMPTLTGSAFCAARFRTDAGSRCGARQPLAGHAPRLSLHLAGRRAGEVTLCSRVLDRRRIVVRRSRGIPAFIRRSCVCCIRRYAVRPGEAPFRMPAYGPRIV